MDKLNLMNRLEFLKKAGFGGAALMALLTSCQDGFTKLAAETAVSTTPVAKPVTGSLDFTIDLSASANAALKNVGGYVVVSGIVVAKTGASTYAAATRTCSHEPKNQVIFQSNEFYCTAHGARFTTAGVGLNREANRGLAIYKTELKDVKTLRIFV
jgi:cytochrome b6-f complex iron-sulfur subunit